MDLLNVATFRVTVMLNDVNYFFIFADYFKETRFSFERNHKFLNRCTITNFGERSKYDMNSMMLALTYPFFHRRWNKIRTRKRCTRKIKRPASFWIFAFLQSKCIIPKCKKDNSKKHLKVLELPFPVLFYLAGKAMFNCLNMHLSIKYC